MKNKAYRFFFYTKVGYFLLLFLATSFVLLLFSPLWPEHFVGSVWGALFTSAFIALTKNRCKHWIFYEDEVLTTRSRFTDIDRYKNSSALTGVGESGATPTIRFGKNHALTGDSKHYE